MNSKLNELREILNEEIVNYSEIKMLFEEKKKILTYEGVDKLVNIDMEITEKINSIKKTAVKRDYLSSELGIKDFKISDLIEATRKNEKELCEQFQAQKEKLSELAEDILTLDKTNRELTKHGIKIANKTLQLIFDGINVKQGEYNSKGKSTDNGVIYSSISEDV